MLKNDSGHHGIKLAVMSKRDFVFCPMADRAFAGISC